MYAYPKAVVNNPAVSPEIAPPVIVPGLGINFNRFDTIAFPAKVAPPAPSVEETKAVIILLLISKPNIAVIEATIATCVGISNAQSEKGIGENPSPNAAAVAVATAVCA